MNVDMVAAARASMRSRTSELDAGRQPYTKEEIRAKAALQARLNLIIGHGCAECTKNKMPWFDDGTGTLLCPILEGEKAGNWKLEKDERATAKGCQMAALYAEVKAGGRADLKASDVLQVVPFALREGLLEGVLAQEAARTAEAERLAEIAGHGPAGEPPPPETEDETPIRS